jgi:hypothetical protein
MTRGVRLVLLASLGSTILAVEGKIQVYVVHFDGAPADGVPVEFVGPKGDTVANGKTTDGKFEVLDLDFEAHTIIVNRGRCSESSIAKVYFRPGNTDLYRVVLNHCYGSGTIVGSGCIFHFRVRDPHGTAVAGAAISKGNEAVGAITDRYGRAVFPVAENTVTRFEVSAPAYRFESFAMQCPSFGVYRKYITLQPESRR